MAAHRKLTLGFALFMTLCAGRTAAEEPLSPTLMPEAGSKTPAVENVWSEGVSEKDRHAADVLFQEGNALLKESIFISAAVKYREALKHWDHPNIHYNLAMALMNVDQPIEMHEHLTGAVKYGSEPLGKARFEHAKNYLTLLDKQVARVKIRCDVQGASVEMDGQSLFVAPGEHEELVRAGMHTIVARREGSVTNNSVRMLEGGKTAVIDLKLRTLEELTTYRRRWPAWIPWTILGAGAAVALGGGGLHYAALQKVSSIDAESRARCPTGCPSEPSDLATQRTQAGTMQKIAVGAYVAGGAAIVGGSVLAYMNRAEPHVRSYDSEEPVQPPRRAMLEIAPILGPDRLGLSAGGRF
jgi:hypothetical protein